MLKMYVDLVEVLRSIKAEHRLMEILIGRPYAEENEMKHMLVLLSVAHIYGNKRVYKCFSSPKRRHRNHMLNGCPINIHRHSEKKSTKTLKTIIYALKLARIEKKLTEQLFANNFSHVMNSIFWAFSSLTSVKTKSYKKVS